MKKRKEKKIRKSIILYGAGISKQSRDETTRLIKEKLNS